MTTIKDNKVPGLAKNKAISGWLYNANGEATSGGSAVGSAQGLTLGWDGLGRLTGVNAPTAKQTYTYDGDNLRVALKDALDPKRDRFYAYGSGHVLLGEYTASRNLSREVIYLGSEVIAEIDAKGTHELHNDHLGTPTLITNGTTGQVEGRQLFGAFGERITEGCSGYTPLTGYTGHLQNEATGLIYMKGRFYSPAWHRFPNSDGGVDPLVENEYSYVGNNPFMATDPNGLRSETWESIKAGVQEAAHAVADFGSGVASGYFNSVGMGIPDKVAPHRNSSTAFQLGRVVGDGVAGVQGASMASGGAGMLATSPATGPAAPALVVVGAGAVTTGAGIMVSAGRNLLSDAPALMRVSSNNRGESAKNTPEKSGASKNEKHGDSGRALTKAEKQVEKLKQDFKNAETRSEKRFIEQKIKNVERAAEKARKGEEHSRGAKR